jgi:hypothetical protein
MAAMTSSLDSNFCPASDFFKFGNKKSHTVPNRVEGAAVGSAIRPICHGDDRVVSRCVVMVEEHFLLRQMGLFFLQFGIKSAQ